VTTVTGTTAPRPRLWRVTDRTSFLELRRQGRRIRRGPLSLTWAAAPTPVGPPRVAFAIGKAAGPAVVRNRMRRRLRAALRTLQARQVLPAGTYLIGAGADAATMSWPDLVDALAGAVEAVTEPAPEPPR
jgi:ribonuclease P protein component